MTNIEKWNLIVDSYNSLYSSLESRLQVEWEMYCTELFGYKKLLHEIDSQRHLTVGSGGSIVPDIILRTNSLDIFDIELKQYNMPFNQTFEKQLISYLNQTHLSVGMIVCNKIYLYYYDYVPNIISKVEIPFEKDNADGIELVDLISKITFSEDNIRNFVLEKAKREKNLTNIKSSLTSEWIKLAVKEKLLESYFEDEIDCVLSEYSFFVKNAGTIEISSATTYNDSLIDVSQIINDWCREKTKNGEINYLENYSSKKYTRFTTADLDTIIPYQFNASSGWNNGHFYTYEIIHRDNKFNIWISFSNKNAPESCIKTFERIMEVSGLKPRKVDWQWWSIFSTKPFKYSSLTTEEEIYAALDAQFREVRGKVSSLLKKL